MDVFDHTTRKDLFLANRSALLDVLNGLIDRLSEFKTALDAADADALRDLLAQGRAARLAVGTPTRTGIPPACPRTTTT